jgi:DNA polymerase (family 10)
MINQELAEIFFDIADILDMKNVEWKPRAYRQAARAVDATSQDLRTIYKKGGLKLLKEIPGVGDAIGKKIVEYIKTGKIKEYERLKKTIPLHISVLTRIPGMGIKKVKKLNKVLKIRTVKQLESAALKHKIAKIPGFGEKSEMDILDGIALMRKSKGRIPLRLAQRTADRIIARLKPLKTVLKISTAGSLRRKKPTIGDIDLLVCSKQPKKVIDAFTKIPNQKILGKGPTKATLVLRSGIQVDLRVVPPKSWGAAQLYFIGSKNYNIELRKIAIKKGYKLNEYGLYDKTTGKQVAGKTEKGVMKKLGVKWIKPEQREK